MSKSLRVTFIVDGVGGFVVGIPLLLAPGRFLGWVGWEPVDPLISRLLGAALIAIGWSLVRGVRAPEATQRILIEMALAFAVLGCAGLLRHLLKYRYPWFVWLTLAVLAVFAIAWAVQLALLMGRRET